MRISRLSSRITLLLTTLCLVISYVAVISQHPEMWYILVILSFLSFVVFMLLLPHRKNIPVTGDRYLGNDCAGVMVATAVNPAEYPLCADLTVMHANGAAVAAIAARAISTSIQHLLGMLLQRQEEMQEELMFTPDVVERHLKRLRRIQAIVSGVVSRANLIIQCYCQIPDAVEIYNKLDKLRQKLDDNVLEKIDEFYKSIPDNVDRHGEVDPWKTKIHDLIKEEIPHVLTRLLRNLFEVEEPARILLEKLESDWQRDLRYFWERELCRPSAEKPPEALKIVP